MFNIISQDKNENSKSQTLLYCIDTCIYIYTIFYVCIYIYIHTHTIYLLKWKRLTIPSVGRQAEGLAHWYTTGRIVKVYNHFGK